MDLLEKPYTTIRLYSIYFSTPIDIKKFALSHKNCKLHFKNLWRCTYKDDNFKLNIHKRLKYILFTKTLDENDIMREMYKLFGKYPTQIVLRNWAIKLNFKKRINLDSLNEELKSTSLNTVFEIILHNKITRTKTENVKKTVQLNKQQFTAVILRPFKGVHKITFSIFATGKINVSGLKKKEDLKVVYHYYKTYLVDVLKYNSVGEVDENVETNEEDNDDEGLFSF